MDKKNILSLPISPIGFGCYALSGAYGARLDESQMIQIIQQAYASGILFYDTADKYGNTEEILGKAVSSFRNKITIATKVGLTNSNTAKLTKEHVIASCEESLQRLKTDYIDIYQVHFDDPDTPVTETIEALEKLVKAGKIRCYGIGHLPMNKTLEYIKLGNVSTVLAEMNAASLNRYRELHPLQSKFDFSVIAFSVTGRGILTGEISSDTKFVNEDIRSIDPLFKRVRLASALRIAEKLKEIGMRYGRTSAQTAISWVIQNPGVALALTGPTKPEHLEENCKAMNWRLEKTDIEEINEFIQKEEDAVRESTENEIYNILSSALSSNFERASNDLIYVLEHSIESGKIDNEAAVPICLSILNMRKSHNGSIDHLIEIQRELRTLMKI
jgi:aryl-alcohol dehydrogenase-like predicted oxidoreductase